MDGGAAASGVGVDDGGAVGNGVADGVVMHGSGDNVGGTIVGAGGGDGGVSYGVVIGRAIRAVRAQWLL